MTSPNGLTNHASPQDMTPEQIQLEIARTRSAITDDLRALSERFDPAQLRESAREVMRDARAEAGHLIEDAKQAALGPLIDAKQRALARVHSLGEQTREASALTLDFLTKNRVMMSLLGVASGLLVYALRTPRRLPRVRLIDEEVPLDEPPMRPRAYDAAPGFDGRSDRARRFVQDHRGTVIATTVLAGIGLGLLLPVARRTRR